MRLWERDQKAQVAFEFIIVYSFILIVFLVFFALIATQRAASLSTQQFSTMQLLAQNIASYIDQGVYAGSGYNVSVPIGAIGITNFNLSVSSTGVVIVSTAQGSQVITAEAFSNARNLVVNGTLSKIASNAIKVYVLPTYTGLIKISNSKGIIYIDQNPAPLGNLAAHVYASVAANTRFALFNTQAPQRGPLQYIASSNYIYPANILLDNIPAFTISGWIYPTNSFAYSTYPVIYGEGNSVGASATSLEVGISGTGNVFITTFNKGTGANVWKTVVGNGNVPLNQWTFFATTLSGGGIGSGTFTVYENNLSVSGTGQVENVVQNGMSFGIGANVPSIIGGQTQLGNFVGGIANLQIYNATLTSNSVNALYRSGIAGPPVNNANLIAWLPLNGNGADYSGNGYSGNPVNVIYQTVVQVNAHVTSSTGAPVIGDPIGFMAGGLVGLNFTGGNYISLITNATGNQTAFIVSNGVKGIINVSVIAYNGNITVSNTLYDWWPLQRGYGVNADDLGAVKQYNTLSSQAIGAGYPGWAPIRNATNVDAAVFPGNPTATGSSPTGSGFININASSAFNAVTVNNSFTASAWVYYTGNTPKTFHCQGIFGNMKNPGSGFQLDAYSCNVLSVNSIPIAWPATGGATYNGLPKNTWEMVTGEYQGSTGLASVYINSTVFATANLGKNLILSDNSVFNIGNNAWQAGGIDTFNGMITNVQFYDSYLSPSQINYLFQQGLAGSPISDAGLIGWWPLAGNAVDYSNTKATTTMSFNVLFKNVAFANYTLTNPNYAISFVPNSVGAGNGLVGNSATLGFIGNQFTLAGWINPKPKQYAPNDNMFYSYGARAGGVSNAVAIGIQQDGVPVLGTYGTGATSNFTPLYGPSVNLNTWNFEAGVVNGRSVSLFLNGVWVNGTLASAPGITQGNVRIGGPYNGVGVANNLFNGSISNVYVYNSVLTAQQIQQLWTNGFPPLATFNVSVS